MVDNSDDFCHYCDDGGNLILCDKCPKVYHVQCLGLRNKPKGVFSLGLVDICVLFQFSSTCSALPGDWLCPVCSGTDARGSTLPRVDDELSTSVAALHYPDADIDEIDGFHIFSFPRPSGPANSSQVRVPSVCLILLHALLSGPSQMLPPLLFQLKCCPVPHSVARQQQRRDEDSKPLGSAFIVSGVLRHMTSISPSHLRPPVIPIPESIFEPDRLRRS